MTRSSGRKGMRKVRVKLRPRMEIGRRTQTGQIRIIAPMTPDVPVARRVPTGQLPSFLWKKKSPVLRARKRIRRIVKMISTTVTSGRGRFGKVGAKRFSSHPRNTPKRRVEITKGTQKCEDLKKENMEEFYTCSFISQFPTQSSLQLHPSPQLPLRHTSCAGHCTFTRKVGFSFMITIVYPTVSPAMPMRTASQGERNLFCISPLLYHKKPRFLTSTSL